MQMTVAISPDTAAWNAALDAAHAAPAEQKDQAITALMQIEDAIVSTPVTSIADAVLRLGLALTMAERQGAEDDPAWCAVAAALDFLQRSETATS